MSEKKTMTADEITAMVETFTKSIDSEVFQKFGARHAEEIGREYQILLMINPNFAHQFTERTLRMTAHLLVWVRKNKGDDWKRPPNPRPEPPAPQGNSARRVLEHA